MFISTVCFVNQMNEKTMQTHAFQTIMKQHSPISSKIDNVWNFGWRLQKNSDFLRPVFIVAA